MTDDMRAFHDIIYRALFGMDTRALLIHFGLPAEAYDDPDDDELLDCVGTLGLQAISEYHSRCTECLLFMEPHKVPLKIAKRNFRLIARQIARQYKARAQELDGDLLTLMTL